MGAGVTQLRKGRTVGSRVDCETWNPAMGIRDAAISLGFQEQALGPFKT